MSFATHFIANPDLVTRFAMNRELATGDPGTYYTGGAGGYVDYPVSGWRDGPRYGPGWPADNGLPAPDRG